MNWIMLVQVVHRLKVVGTGLCWSSGAQVEGCRDWIMLVQVVHRLKVVETGLCYYSVDM